MNTWKIEHFENFDSVFKMCIYRWTTKLFCYKPKDQNLKIIEERDVCMSWSYDDYKQLCNVALKKSK